MSNAGDEMTLCGEPLKVKMADNHIVVFDRLAPPPPVKKWVPVPKIYIITTARVGELVAEGALMPTVRRLAEDDRQRPFIKEELNV